MCWMFDALSKSFCLLFSVNLLRSLFCYHEFRWFARVKILAFVARCEAEHIYRWGRYEVSANIPRCSRVDSFSFWEHLYHAYHFETHQQQEKDHSSYSKDKAGDFLKGNWGLTLWRKIAKEDDIWRSKF